MNVITVSALSTDQSPRKMNSFNIGWDLVMSLVMPEIRRRPINDRISVFKYKIATVTGEYGQKVPVMNESFEKLSLRDGDAWIVW